MKFLDKINSPADLKKLSVDELPFVADEVRSAVLNKISNAGGHIGPNLGIVELTVALHYVFNSPLDKIIFDVSHQTYPHKILTGRKHAYLDPKHFKDVSGFTNPKESEHDFFTIGHTSTSISLACGMAKARDLSGGKENIVAVIGDGSLSGGEAFEGMNNAVEAGTNMIIVVNDNEMSIGENVGGLYKNLEQLRNLDGKAENNLFKAIGLDYLYVDDGHDLKKLINAFKSVKDTLKPVVVHVHTTKGKGFARAEEKKEMYHAGGPFDIKTGEWKFPMKENYSSITAKFLRSKMKEDKSIAVITSGTPIISGFSIDERKSLSNQFIDVGICEQHAISLISGMAKNGAKPVYCAISSFIQRTYDQLSQDLCLNKNPAVIIVFGSGLNGFKDETHLGRFDIPLMSNIPNLVYLAPTCKNEYLAMLDWALTQRSHPVAIRAPGNLDEEELWKRAEPVQTDFSNINTYEVTEKGSDVAIIALGTFYRLGLTVKEELKNETGIDATLINPRFITGTDETCLTELYKNHKLVITLEDGQVEGGFGEKISRFYAHSSMKVLNFGGKKEFTNPKTIDELLKRYHLTPNLICDDIKKVLNA